MGRETLRVLTRSSPLAVIQTKEAVARIQRVLSSPFDVEISVCTSPGDRDLKTPLTDPAIADDFFTRDLDEALTVGDGDLAVHSAKDLPRTMRDDLTIAALLPAEDIRDALVYAKGLKNPEQLQTIASSSKYRERFIRQQYPEAEIRPIRGTIEDRIHQIDTGTADALVVAACAMKRLGLSDRLDRYLNYDPYPQQGRLALVVRKDRSDLIARLRVLDIRHNAGMVALVGCAADPSLISMRARQYLEQADIVFHDRLVPDEIIAPRGDKAVLVGKAGGRPSTPQSEIHRLMLEAAEQGRLVVRLQGGDPGIYGHLAGELEFLKNWNIRCEVVPSISAAQVAGAHAGAPLTHARGGHAVTFISAHPKHTSIMHQYPDRRDGNIAVYMGVKQLQTLCSELIDNDWPPDTPVIAAEKLGQPDECLTRATLATCDTLCVAPPSLFLIGNHSFPPDCVTLFTGSDPAAFISHGPLIHCPLITLTPQPLAERTALLEQKLHHVDGVMFPSKTAVHTCIEALMDLSDVRALQGKKILAVGPSTEKALYERGICVDGCAQSFRGIAELKEHIGTALAGRYLYPCSDMTPQQHRIDSMREAGIELIPAVFYRNEPVRDQQLPRRPFHRVLFTSGSTVQRYFEQFPSEQTQDRIWLAVGPSTQAALESRGLKTRLLPSRPK